MSRNAVIINVAIKVGEEMAGYEVQKREAIQCEDYNLAEEKRSQSEICCQEAFKRLNLTTLLNESDTLALNLEGSSQLNPIKAHNTTVELQPIKTKCSYITTQSRL